MGLSGNISRAAVSGSVVESAEDSFIKSEPPLPAPPAGRRRLALGSLITVGVAALVVVYLLVPSARYALRKGAPQELGPLADASLTEVNTWVSTTGTPEPNALGFTRLGARGSFRLTRAQERKEVWLLFQVPASIEGQFVPPTHFVGRLRHLRDAGILPVAVQGRIEARLASNAPSVVLVEGESPASQRPALLAAILLALVAAACLSSAFFLWRDVKSPSPQS